jgi:hypothetical protein
LVLNPLGTTWTGGVPAAGSAAAAHLASLTDAGETPEECADRLALAAATLTVAAWEVRGNGQADTVGDDAADRFDAMLEEADDLALAALRTVPDHPACATTRVTVGRGRGVPADDLVHRFEVARRRDERLFPAHLQMLQTVCAKWWGSHEAMFDLVRQSLEVTPPGHPTTAVLPVAHLELMVSGDPSAPGRRRADLPTVIRLSEALLATGASHPRALEAHSAFGWFFAAVEDRRRAKAHLERLRHRPGWTWGYLGDDPRVPFVAVARSVGLGR